MNDLDPRLRHLFWFVAELFAALALALALLLIIVRLAMPHAAVFKPHLEAGFAKAGGGKSLASFDIAPERVVVIPMARAASISPFCMVKTAPRITSVE